MNRELNWINLSNRPLPSGRISIRELWTMFSIFTILGFITTALLGQIVFVIVFVFWAIAFRNNMKLKEFGSFSNLIVAFCLGIIFILAEILADYIKGHILIFALLVIFFHLREKIACDEIRSTQSIA
jgi:geranylgeranylglycerol-phosphate geranylgeranyltransferase